MTKNVIIQVSACFLLLISCSEPSISNTDAGDIEDTGNGDESASSSGDSSSEGESGGDSEEDDEGRDKDDKESEDGNGQDDKEEETEESAEQVDDDDDNESASDAIDDDETVSDYDAYESDVTDDEDEESTDDSSADSDGDTEVATQDNSDSENDGTTDETDETDEDESDTAQATENETEDETEDDTGAETDDNLGTDTQIEPESDTGENTDQNTGGGVVDEFILGADISWIDEREDNGVRYSDQGTEKDIFEILKDHDFNWIRLRLFVDPTANVPGESESPYSAQGYCDLEHTLGMSNRIKDAGMKFLLDFHYSDVWADPGKQYKPVSWEGLSFDQLVEKVRSYTRESLEAFEANGTLPDMVQVGNEVVGGMIWPDGRNSNMGNFAALVNAGIDGVEDVDPSIGIMIHSISENSPSGWLSSLKQAGVDRIDVFGLSYYSEWHGTPDDLQRMLNDVAANHDTKVVVAEYADNHRRVNDIVYGLPGNKGVGTFVWEPADWMEALFDWTGGGRATNSRIDLYPEMASDFSDFTPFSF